VTARRAALIAGGGMLAVYVATLAPSVTFWDAGEFIAAARVLGIPHPPGTPLFVVLLNLWARGLAFLSFPAATNLFSAVCTAFAVALTAWIVARAASSWWIGLAAITAGAMTSVWQNATETEVYAASLALSLLTLVVADVAGRTRDRRWLTLTAYLIALALPLHLSALVAAPAAIYLAARRDSGAIDWTAATMLLAAATATFGVSRISVAWCIVAVLLFAIAVVMERRSSGSVSTSLSTLAATVVAFSCVLFLLVRARHDPAINQGNPSTWFELGQVIARRQYAVAGLWPRQAPLWLQLANWFEYADWQFALSLSPSVVPTVGRVVATLLFATLGLVGMRWQRTQDRRTWAAFAILFASGSLGVLVYLNLKAGSSFAWGFVPNDAAHEARDRDYFFVLGFWVWGVWAGLGAFALASRFRLPSVTGFGLAALPVALNWSAVTRRGEPEASLPREVAAALLDSLPRNAVLFVAGDNDTYPLWYAQQVDHRRQDVTVVTLPLLAASWYADELGRRHGIRASAADLVADPRASMTMATARGLARAASEAGLPVALSLTVPASDRDELKRQWMVSGVYLVSVGQESPTNSQSGSASTALAVDSQRTAAAVRAIDSWRKGRASKPSTDPTSEYFLHALSCPSLILEHRAKAPVQASLDSTCNLR
jgi:hypothetical protein